MSAFCVNCGTQLADGAGFCSKCGKAVTAQGAPAAASSITAQAATPTAIPPAPAPITPQSSNMGTKIIFGILAVVMFFGLLMAGTCFYIAYRVRQKAHEFSRQMGSDVTPYSGRREPCTMLTTNDASKILGQPVTSVRQRGIQACEYEFGTDGKRLNIEYTWDGGAMTMKLTHGAMKQISGMETFIPVNGIGDEAYVAPGGSGLMMRKGDVLVSIDLRVNGVSTDSAKKIASEIADNL
jgi:hypothetical protein